MTGMNESNKKTLSYIGARGWSRAALSVAAFGSCAWANSNPTIGDLATNITGSFGGLTQLMVGTAYVAGIGFGVAAVFKFKQHKDNPTQVPIGTPITMLAISAALVFLPGVYSPLGSTIFGPDSTGEAGGNTGAGASAIPGFTSGS